jgi:hypothetical protein
MNVLCSGGKKTFKRTISHECAPFWRQRNFYRDTHMAVLRSGGKRNISRDSLTRLIKNVSSEICHRVRVLEGVQFYIRLIRKILSNINIKCEDLPYN